jgi:hypothetical protein
MTRPLACLSMIFPLATGALAQVSIDGIEFVDHGIGGVIDLGAHRGGFAVLDYDDDGYPDLVIGGTGGQLQRLMHNEPDPARPGERTFVDVTAGSGLDDAEGQQRIGDGMVAADYDNDGDVDVFMIGRFHPGGGIVSHGLLYRNDGGTFTNVSVDAGVRANGYAGSVSWNDVDLDGDVDLLLLGQGTGGGPRVRLLSNDGDGTFTDRSDLMPVVPGTGAVYSHMWMDYDGDGYADCFALWNGPKVLRSVPGITAGERMFVNATFETGFTILGPAPMGIAAGDHDNDGDFDIAVSNGAAGEYYRNDDGFMTRFFPLESIWAWGVMWLDVDNDGALDHMQTGSSGSGANFDKLFRNLGGGAWQDVSAALNGVSVATRYAVQLDYDNDGRMDVVALDPSDYTSVYENVSTTTGHWITLRLRGDGRLVNRSAIGAIVRVTAGGATQVRSIVSGSSTTSTEDLRAHFGLGAATTIDSVEVLWPRRGSLASRTETFAGPFAVDAIHEIHAGCPEDLGDDGVVGFGDILDAIGAWGPCANCVQDLDGNGMVDFADVLAIIAAWGPCP